jgi:hypothetical protein
MNNRGTTTMETFMKSLLMPGIACLVLAGCATPPTKPDAFDTLKKNAVDCAAALQNEVAALRGKNFLRNVRMAVYTRDEYAAMLHGQIAAISPDQREFYNKILQREGLLHANADYYATYDSLMANQVGGFYQPGADSLYLVVESGTRALTFDDSIALFHELVHALQDQYHDLTQLYGAITSSDRYYALDYTVEGEAELLTMYYAYKLFYGSYPSTPGPVVYQFDTMATIVNHFLDSLHAAGEPLLCYQPVYWAYYSYGPLFINAVAGMNWPIIDNVIFAALPVATSEIMHPQTYISKNEHSLNVTAMLTTLDNTQVLYDVDELGEMLTCVLFREWDFPGYASLAQGLLADKMITFSDSLTDSLRLIWYTLWQDSMKSAMFTANYASLIQNKLNITLPAPVIQGTKTMYSDTVDCVYAEQDSTYAFVMEKYEPAHRDLWIAELRSVTVSTLAKKAVAGRPYPFVKKRRPGRWLQLPQGSHLGGW